MDLEVPEHRALMVLLGSQSRREAVRSRHRVLAAMRTQACEQRRFLGGRPPYGYRLVDVGPHPIAEHAWWGRRLYQLEPDPVTGPWVRWIFAQRAARWSIAGIARELNDRGVPCPSGASFGAGVEDTNCGRDSGEPALHRQASVEPHRHGPESWGCASCRWHGAQHELRGVGGVDRARPCGVGG